MKPSNLRLWIAAFFPLFAAACSPVAALHEGSYTLATAAPEGNVLSIFDGKADAQLNLDGTACVSIVWRTIHTVILWPNGYTARGNPLAVFDADGKEVLVAGQELSVSGGQVFSSRARKVAGCSGFSQSVAFVPFPSPIAATPGLEEYDDLQVGDMQRRVDGEREIFGGLVGNPMSKVVTIYIATTADPGRVAQAKAAVLAAGARPGFQYPKPWRLGFVVAGPSLAALDGVLNRLQVVQPWRKDVGSNLMGWGIDPARHAVRISVLEISPTISADARSAFGNLAVLETAERVELQ
jgi:hypothetical protein